METRIFMHFQLNSWPIFLIWAPKSPVPRLFSKLSVLEITYSKGSRAEASKCSVIPRTL